MAAGRRKQNSIHIHPVKWERRNIHADSGRHVLYFDGEECLIYLIPLLGVYEEIGSKIGTNHMISWDVTKD